MPAYPVASIPLVQPWSTVILSNGDRIYYDGTKSVWQLPESAKEASEKVQQMSKSILLAVAAVRGYDWRHCEGSEQVSEWLGESKEEEDKKVAQKPKESQKLAQAPQEPDQTSEDVPKPPTGLDLGYSDTESSDESSVASSDGSAEFALDLDDLDDLNDLEDPKQAFFDMLDRHDIDPYSSWDIEVEALVEEPEFAAVESDERREELFNEWAKKQVAGNEPEEAGSERAESDEPAQSDSETLESNDEPSDPLDTFIAFLKSHQLPQYYFELRRKYRDNEEFQELNNDRQRETIFKKYVAFLKSDAETQQKALQDKTSLEYRFITS